MAKTPSIIKQMSDLVNNSMRIGESKHAAKVDGIAKSGIFSFNSARAMKNTWCNFAKFCRSEFDLRDIQKVTPQMVREYLEKKAYEDEISAKSYANVCSRIEKLNTALEEKRGIDVSELRAELKECRAFIEDLRAASNANRAYLDPEKTISQIEDPKCRLAAKIQFEGGARISEISKLDKRNLTSNEGEIVLRNTKGGLIRTTKVSPETYEELKKIIEERDQYRLDIKKYRTELREAALRTGDDPKKSTHGFRFNFAQKLYFALLAEGMSPPMAKSRVSSRLGHKRTEITERYLSLIMLAA